MGRRPSGLVVSMMSNVRNAFYSLKYQSNNCSLVFAKKEVILSAGTMDTPKLLLLSGVGPAEDLAKHNIPVVEDIPGVGSNLRDHYMMRMRTLLAAGTLPPLDNDFIIKAREQWLVDQTGPLSDDKAMATAGYFKLDVSSRPEFKLLDQQTQNLLLRPSTPAYEYAPVSRHAQNIHK